MCNNFPQAVLRNGPSPCASSNDQGKIRFSAFGKSRRLWIGLKVLARSALQDAGAEGAGLPKKSLGVLIELLSICQLSHLAACSRV